MPCSRFPRRQSELLFIPSSELKRNNPDKVLANALVFYIRPEKRISRRKPC